MVTTYHGFRTRRFGKIPSDWNLVEFKHLITDGPTNGLHKPSENIGLGDSLLFDINGLYSGLKADFSNCRKVQLTQQEKKQYALKDSDILFNRVSVKPEGVGKAVIVEGVPQNTVFESNMIRVRVNQSQISPEFLVEYLAHPLARKQILSHAKITAQTSISQEAITSLLVLLPSVSEQHKIVDLLSTWNDTITKTTELIAILRKRKKGLIQYLITGSIRFKEFIRSDKFLENKYGKFPVDWKQSSTKLLFYIKGRIGWRGLKKSEFTESGPYLITGVDFNEYGDVSWERCFHISQERYIESPEIIVKQDDILITKDGTIGKVAFVSALPGEATLNSHVLLVRPKSEDIYPLFAFYVYQSDVFKLFVEQNKSGSTLTGLPQGVFEKFPFYYPSFSEQKMIAEVLRACDLEIKLYSQKLEILKLQKKGLMQKLFTGEVRVKV